MPRRTVRTIPYSLSFSATAGTANNQVLITAPTLTAANMTIVVWIKPTGSTNRVIRGATADSGATTSQGINFRVNNNNRLELLKQSVASMGTSNRIVPNGEWVHVGVKYDGATVTFYMNGLPTNSVASSQTFATANVILGNRTPTTEPFNGLMSEYREYTTTLTDAEIYTLYTNSVSTSSPSLKFNFTEGAGTTATDTSGNGKNGVITSGSWSTDVPITNRTLAGTRIAA